MVVFNEVHNQNLNTSVGIVSVLTEDNKRVYKNIKDHGTDITYENEFKIKNEKKIDWHSIWRFYENKKNTKIKNFKF